MKIQFITIFISVFSISYGQVLSLDEALKIALSSNLNLSVSETDIKIAKTQNNWGNAGMAPVVTLAGSSAAATTNSYQEFSTGTTQKRNGANSFALNGSLNVTWTIFDGFKMFAIKDRLNINEELAQITLKKQVESTIYDVSLAYIDVIKQQELLKTQYNNINIFNERERISKLRSEIGIDSQMDLMLIQLDKNKAIADIKRNEISLNNSKATLNKLLNRNAGEIFTVEEKIEFSADPNYTELLNEAENTNLSLAILKKNELIAYKTINEAKGNLLPTIQIGSSYTVLSSQNQAGIQLKNQQNGLNGNLSLNWVLFNGQKNASLVQVNKLRYVSQQYLTRLAQLQIENTLYTYINTFKNQKEIAALETNNLELSTKLSEITLERYKVGKTGILETIEVQKNLEDSQARYITALYETKKAEIELLKASNKLVK